MLKVCNCGAEFESRGYRDYYCKSCRQAYDKKRYQQDKGIGKSHSVEYYRRKQGIVQEAKSVPCKDCGQSYPYYVMEFDHLPGHTKVRAISRLMASGSVDRLLLEMQKCEVVCANCHRERTYQRTLD